MAFSNFPSKGFLENHFCVLAGSGAYFLLLRDDGGTQRSYITGLALDYFAATPVSLKI